MFLYAFDLPRHDGEDLRPLPLRERKARPRRGARVRGPIRFNPHRNGEHGEELYREACRKGLEGVIAKRADSPYVGSRSRDWLKLKCHAEQELVIGGFTAPKGSRTEFGALLVGYYDDGVLRYAGKVGTGFDQATLRSLGARMRELEQDESPFEPFKPIPPRDALGRPELVGQVAFAEWTRDGRLRATLATSGCATTSRRARSCARCHREDVEITQPGQAALPRRRDQQGRPRLYYERVSEWMLPHISFRPVSMQRFPDGIEGKGFFHKDVPGLLPRLGPPGGGAEVGRHRDAWFVSDADALVYLVGQNTITPHVWLSRADRVWQPDRMVIDLDPPPGSDFNAVRAPRARPASSCASSASPFAQVTGSKGIHVWTPLRRRARTTRCARSRGDLARVLAARHPTSSRPSSARPSARAASWWTPRATRYAQTAVPPYAVGRGRARRSPPRSSGRSCPTRSCARTAGTSNVLRRLAARATRGRTSPPTRAASPGRAGAHRVDAPLAGAAAVVRRLVEAPSLMVAAMSRDLAIDEPSSNSMTGSLRGPSSARRRRACRAAAAP